MAKIDIKELAEKAKDFIEKNPIVIPLIIVAAVALFMLNKNKTSFGLPAASANEISDDKAAELEDEKSGLQQQIEELFKESTLVQDAIRLLSEEQEKNLAGVYSDFGKALEQQNKELSSLASGFSAQLGSVVDQVNSALAGVSAQASEYIPSYSEYGYGGGYYSPEQSYAPSSPVPTIKSSIGALTSKITQIGSGVSKAPELLLTGGITGRPAGTQKAPEQTKPGGLTGRYAGPINYNIGKAIEPIRNASASVGKYVASAVKPIANIGRPAQGSTLGKSTVSNIGKAVTGNLTNKLPPPIVSGKAS